MAENESAKLTLSHFERLIFEGDKISLSEAALSRTSESFNFLKTFAKGRIIYGVNTGFGPMAQHVINPGDLITLQYNLIRSHCTGAGRPLPAPYVKAAMIARLNTMALGYSGVHQSALDILVNLINYDITPLIFEHGGVGASGDLVQLAHLALVMIGEGEVHYKGELQPTEVVFEKLGIEPMKIHLREGLAAINGTSVMTGIGIINSHYALRAIEWSVMASAMITQLVDSFDDYYSKELNRQKNHVGQQAVAKVIFDELSASQCGRNREETVYKSSGTEEILTEKLQEYYSIRCVPQVVGAILDTTLGCRQVLENELNSVSDNPVIDVENQNVYHGGNFHGDYVSLEMDKLKMVITKLGVLAERQINFLMNPALNNILPPFVNHGKLGFNFGLQGLQFTATSTTAENQMLSNPMYVHSIPNNNDNQDVVSMGTNAALVAKQVIENAFEVLAIEMLTIVQAVEYTKKEDQLSPNAQAIYRKVRAIIPSFIDDKPMYAQVRRLKETLMNEHPTKELFC